MSKKTKKPRRARLPKAAHRRFTRTPLSTVPCPLCGSPSRVYRASLGARVVSADRDHVLRERYCVGRAHHKFTTEERAK